MATEQGPERVMAGFQLAGLRWATKADMVADGAWPGRRGDVAWAWSTDGGRFFATKHAPHAVPMAEGVILDAAGGMPEAARHFCGEALALIKASRYGVPVRVFQRAPDGSIGYVGLRRVHTDPRGFGASVARSQHALQAATERVEAV